MSTKTVCRKKEKSWLLGFPWASHGHPFHHFIPARNQLGLTSIAPGSLAPGQPDHQSPVGSTAESRDIALARSPHVTTVDWSILEHGEPWEVPFDLDPNT